MDTPESVNQKNKNFNHLSMIRFRKSFNEIFGDKS